MTIPSSLYAIIYFNAILVQAGVIKIVEYVTFSEDVFDLHGEVSVPIVSRHARTLQTSMLCIKIRMIAHEIDAIWLA